MGFRRCGDNLFSAPLLAIRKSLASSHFGSSGVDNVGRFLVGYLYEVMTRGSTTKD